MRFNEVRRRRIWTERSEATKWEERGATKLRRRVILRGVLSMERIATIKNKNQGGQFL